MSNEMELKELQHRIYWRGIYSGDGTQSSHRDHGETLQALNERWKMNMRFLDVSYETNLFSSHAERQEVQGFFPGQKEEDPF